jgi:hypothetical protein
MRYSKLAKVYRAAHAQSNTVLNTSELKYSEKLGAKKGVHFRARKIEVLVEPK